VLKSENFIYFLTVIGFFIGLLFSIFNELEPEDFLYAILLLSGIFYIIGLASSSFFIKFNSVKNSFELNKDFLEKTIDMQIYELDKKEEFIREAYYFIKEIEQEEELLYTNTKKEYKK
jgi:hypothetical protein